MGIWHKLLDKFSLYDLIIIAMMAALGIAIKPVIIPPIPPDRAAALKVKIRGIQGRRK